MRHSTAEHRQRFLDLTSNLAQAGRRKTRQDKTRRCWNLVPCPYWTAVPMMIVPRLPAPHAPSHL
ncbi:hypothetical protein DL95DRAFT_386339, partial [Leptodontidium sp. 2 PMI_412]